MDFDTYSKGPLWTRTKEFALRVVRMYARLPKTREAQVIGGQVLRRGTPPGAQYREACRARSRAEFVSKMASGFQELEETANWFELLIDGGIIPDALLKNLCDEARELIAMFVSSIKTAKA